MKFPFSIFISTSAATTLTPLTPSPPSPPPPHVAMRLCGSSYTPFLVQKDVVHLYAMPMRNFDKYITAMRGEDELYPGQLYFQLLESWLKTVVDGEGYGFAGG
ncbi:hypothetical protein Hanom_Chr02g00106521 [Helianthus anomalus]